MRGFAGMLVAAAALGGTPVAAVAAEDAPGASGGFAPDVATVPVGLRADFRLGWNVTDGVGMIDHVGLGGSVGPVFGRPCFRCPPAVAPFADLTAGIAEEGRPSLRVTGGVELAGGLGRGVELVPSVAGGYMVAFDDDERRGGTVTTALALRVRGDDGFFFAVEPVRFVLLPPPEGGWTRYTTHFALDFGIVRFGGITP